MRTLLIPCAGSRMVDGLPLYLNRHPDGELLAIKSITGVFPENYERVIFTILQEADERYGAAEKIKESIGDKWNADVCILNEKTNGPAETVYKTIIAAGVEGEFAVRDSHAYIELDKDYSGNFIAGLDLTEYEKPIENLRSKSFIVLNEQKQVLDVIEKHFCSDVISAGLYGFKHTDDFKMAYEHLSDPNYPISKMYLSHIISYLIGYSQRVFHSAKIPRFEDWSTKTAWQKVQKSHSTCFLDLDTVCGNTMPFDEKIIMQLIKLSKAGISFIGFSTQDNDMCDVMEYLCSAGINIITIVNGCTNSKVRSLILDKEDLNEMALEV